MTEKEQKRLEELRSKDRLDEKELAQWKFLEKKVVTDERVKQFRKNQAEPYASKRSRAINLAWEFYRQVEGQCYTAGFISMNVNLDHIKAICKKPMEKVPKGLSEYGITTEEVEKMFVAFCKQK